MAHSNPPDPELKELLTTATTIAIVGASSNPDKASYGNAIAFSSLVTRPSS